jgi:hypothetical protein
MNIGATQMPAAHTALGDQAMAELCRLLEQDEAKLAPDAIWLSGKATIYAHLRDIDGITLSNDLAGDVVCHDCCNETFRPLSGPENGLQKSPYRGYCPECGWVDLTAEQARIWHVQPLKIARWLAAALQLTPRYVPEPVVDGVLWRLGEAEFRRRRRTLFFARRLIESADVVRDNLNELVAPGAEVVITTSDIATLRGSALADRLMVPLRAVAHIRKAGFVIENLDSYLTGAGPVEKSDETSLRLMHTRRVALVNGEEYKLSPQVYDFLKILEDADGDEVHKRHLAEALGIDGTFRTADIFKRHKPVFETFIEADQKGSYWLKPDFVNLERR